MFRFIYSDLLEWKRSAHHKPLVVNGARQIGKTYILKQFGKAEYRQMAYINLDRDAAAKSLFEQDYDVKRIIRAISAHTNVDITPGDTLIFIDEIQESPKALASLKYLKEDASEYDVAVAGSLLGISIHRNLTFPVGDVNMLQMYPMTFGEFLIATGNEMKERELSEHNWAASNSLSVEYIDLLRQYYYVGGMPEAVKAFAEGKGPGFIRTIQKDILLGYKKDFSKHAPASEVPRINMVWDSIPSQLAKENKKFIFGAVRKSGRSKDFEMAIQWLTDAGLTYKIHRVTKIGIPLKFYEEPMVFKLFILDVGLMGAMVDAPASLVLNDNRIFTEYKGAFAELYVCTQLMAMKTPVYYHSTNESTVEIDFAAQIGDRSIPIEVKAEENTKAKSFKTFLEGNPDLTGIRYSMLGYAKNDRFENFPLYAVAESLTASIPPQEPLSGDRGHTPRG